MNRRCISFRDVVSAGAEKRNIEFGHLIFVELMVKPTGERSV